MSGYAPQKLQVFISSTFADLRLERQAAIKAILNEGHVPAGMELFADIDDSHIEAIKRWIDNADVYFLILGRQYGTIEPESGKSYLQLEYEYALSQNIPVYTFVVEDAKAEGIGKITRRIGTRQLEYERWQAFRLFAMENVVVEWKDHHDISHAVTQTLTLISQKNNLSGWIKLGDESNLFPGNVSFQTVSPFPGFFPVLCQNLESARKSIDILCDYPAYGLFSDYETHSRYKEILARKAKEGVELHVLSPNKSVQKELLIKQFDIDTRSWSEIRDDENFSAKLLQFEEIQQRTFLDAESFILHFLEIQERMYKDSGQIHHRVIDMKPPLLYWITDKTQAVISIPTFSSDVYEVGLKTKDRDIIQTLMSIMDFVQQDASMS